MENASKRKVKKFEAFDRRKLRELQAKVVSEENRIDLKRSATQINDRLMEVIEKYQKN